ncbi:RNA-guided endonuclease InsQ/TnpB family protein [Parabacteroides sp. APC149_11_2_Y6]
MRATYKYKAYTQNRNHQRRLEGYLRAAAWVYNHCIALHKWYYRLYHKRLPMYDLQKHLTKLKRQNRYESWAILSSQSIQQITEKISEGYKRFFKKQAKRPPTFRSWRKYKSVTFKNTGWIVNGNVFTINALKLRLKFHKSRELEGQVKTVTLKQDAVGDWWLSFSLEMEYKTEMKPKTGKSAGFDFGMKTFLTASDGESIHSPLVLFHSLDKLKRDSRNLSRKQKGSRSRKRARLELVRFHRRIENRREDFQWKLANSLVSRYDLLCFEDLNMKAMQKVWGRKINDLAFAGFLNKVEYLAGKHGKRVIKINRWEPSSKTCSCCGHKEDKMPLDMRQWTCPECGAHHDRDVNAAKNILQVGTSTLEGGAINPAIAG